MDTPYERLKHMNPSAIEVYSSHHIDLSGEYLEIAVCAQHNNGELEETSGGRAISGIFCGR